ncbi:FAD-dependent monooxygenase [Pseudomonas luteola]|uniref:FAD-dependent oxidoreductase n=1 Tax=Pseudomonas luteola TaxID=47886 RepID=UPI00388D6538
MEKVAIGIVGAGTAGLATATFLARRGYQVRLFERVPELRTVGAGILLQPSGLAVLHTLGVLTECTALGAPVSRLYGTSMQGKRVVLDTRYDAWRPGSFGLGVHRGVLMTSLLNAARHAGVSIETSSDITRFHQTPSHVQLFHRDAQGNESLLGDFAALVLADGTRSALRGQMAVKQHVKPYPWGALWSMVSTPAHADSTELRQWYRHCSEMFGIMPTGCTHQKRDAQLSSLFWSLPVIDYPQWQTAGLDSWKRQVVKLAGETARPFLQHINQSEQLAFAAYADVWMQRWSDGRVLAIGDCAHAMSPQLGQGVNMALVDAAALADAVDMSMPSRDHWPTVFEAYSVARREHLRYYRQASRFLTPLFQSHSKALGWLRDSALFLARHNVFGRRHAVTTLVGARTGWLLSTRREETLYHWDGQQDKTWGWSNNEISGSELIH